MPPLSAYTPFESLLFFQSLASLDSRPSSFVSISDLLRSNPFVRQNVAFNADRLSPEALEDLYTTLMRDGLEAATLAISPAGPNGHSPDPSATNPRKRKISSPRPDGLVDSVARHSRMVPELVAHLYAKYKELATREIRQEEKRFREIRNDIERLQKEEREASVQQAPRPGPQVPPEAKQMPGPERVDIDIKEEKPVQPPVTDVNKHPVEPPARTQSPQPQLSISQQAPSQATPTQEPPSVQQPRVQQSQRGQIQQPQIPRPPQPIPHMQTGHPPPQQVNGKPPQPALMPRNPVAQRPTNVSPAPRIPPSGVPEVSVGPSRPPALQAANGSNLPVAPHAPPSAPTPPAQRASQGGPPVAPSVKPQRPPDQPQPSFQQWPLNPPAPQTPQASYSPYASPQHPNKVAAGLPFPSPLPQQALQTEAGKPYQKSFSPAFPATPGSRSQVQSPAPGVHGSGYETPISAAQAFSESRGFRQHRPSVDTAGSATPWKRTPRLSIPQSPSSPNRPRPEDVSPISERAPSPFEPPEAAREAPSSHRRKTHKTPRTSTDKDVQSKLSGRKKRDESTPSSRSRGRSMPSRDAASPADSTSASQTKIKHEMPSTPAGVPDVVEPEPRSAAGRKSQDDRPGRGRPKRKRGVSELIEPESFHAEISRMDPTESGQYVLSARNFPRTGAPIMNDVTMHKHASIFTKPLTERDAPGYRDLIYRPQDLKSIKSLIHQGSKAVSAATEAASTPAADGESPAPSGTPSKNAVLMLPKTEDVIPPKAVVNSTQLEKELIRMFANAIMFNPIPERGFGLAFPMISDDGSRESTQIPEADEGGIIKDTLDMFEDVEQAVTRWRAAERTADELASKSILSLRRGSEVNDGVDDSK